jgi:pyrimidine deaminase RibD-like protein
MSYDLTPDEVRALAEAAVKAAAESKAEDRPDAPPRVGAAIRLRDGRVVTAYRGESGPGDHAEYCLLEKKLSDVDLVGSTLFTTLEPCTRRSPNKVPCSDRIQSRKIARVIIGMIDPNPKIRGGGILRLRKANIDISFFPGDLMARAEDLNRHFSHGILAVKEHDPEELLMQLARFSGLGAVAEKEHQQSVERYELVVKGIGNQLRERFAAQSVTFPKKHHQALAEQRRKLESQQEMAHRNLVEFVKQTETRYAVARTVFLETLARLPAAARREFDDLRAKLKA